MKNLKDPNYVMLEKEFYNLYEKLEEENEILKEKIFGEANKKLRVYEEEVKEEFLNVWKKYGNPEIIFNNFKICLDPQNNHNFSLIKTLTANNKKLDLEKIARNCPEKERKHEKLDYNKEYKKVAEKMIGILRKEGLFSRWSDIKEIKEFQKKFNILSFEPKYFE
ncbi:MAG: hypothetical protein AABX80_02495 [Nanoarchaeota archaeon]